MMEERQEFGPYDYACQQLSGAIHSSSTLNKTAAHKAAFGRVHTFGDKRDRTRAR
jgi:hypothetical protein